VFAGTVDNGLKSHRRRRSGGFSPPLLVLAAEAHLRVANNGGALELGEARKLLSTLG
jgi:hypothetical protein